MLSNNSFVDNFVLLLTILFIGLRLSNIIQWHWAWVLAPVWVVFIVALILSFVEAVKSYETNL